jgi:transposase
MQSVIGVDVAKATFDIALPLLNGKYRTRAKVANSRSGWDELLAWRARHAPQAVVVMEATGTYHEGLAEALVQANVTVYVVNPARIKAYGRSELSRTKTDSTDAKLIARFFLAQHAAEAPLHPYTPPTPAQARLRALVRRLDDLKGMQQMELNRHEVANEAVRPGIEQVLATLKAQIKATEQAIRDHIDNHPDLRAQRDLLTSIPGIAQTTSAMLIAALGDLRAYSDVRQIVAFAGLNPALRDSGNHVGRATISRVGDADLRAKLYMPAIVARKHNPILAAFAQRLADRGKAGKVIICAVMRKLLHLVWGVLRSGKPFDPKFGLA